MFGWTELLLLLLLAGLLSTLRRRRQGLPDPYGPPVLLAAIAGLVASFLLTPGTIRNFTILGLLLGVLVWVVVVRWRAWQGRARGASHRMRTSHHLGVWLLCAVSVALMASASAAQQNSRGKRDHPIPSPLIEREEVRFITIDLVVEKRTRGRWRPFADLDPESLMLHVGTREVAIESVENLCPTEDGVPILRADRGEKDTETPGPTGDATAPGDVAEVGPVRYVIYLDYSRLTLDGIGNTAIALRDWGLGEFHEDDEVMIVTADWGLRVVRPFAPAREHLQEDLANALGMAGGSEIWSEWMDTRTKALEDSAAFAGLRGDSPGELMALQAEEEMRQKRSYRNLEAAMTLFNSVEGTKNFIFFQERFPLYPGQDSFLRATARAANRRNVRIYPIYAGGLERGGLVSDAGTYLASETGGQWVDRTNDLTAIFDRAEEDIACFYRVGFYMEPRYDGRSRKIILTIAGHRGQYRFRHARTVDDPTQEQMNVDVLMAALLDPPSADTFPVSLTVVPILDHEDGRRVRVQVTASLDDLLSVAVVEEPGARQTRVMVGGIVVPLRERGPDEVEARGTWDDVDERRELLEFGKQSILISRPSPDGDPAPTRLLFTEELNLPPDRYRIAVVVQDQLARDVAAAVVEVEVPDERPLVGDVRLALVNPVAAAMEEEKDPKKRKPGRLFVAPPTLPQRTWIPAEASVESGESAAMVYGLCDPTVSDSGNDTPAFHGWRLDRSLQCDGSEDPVPLTGSRIPAPGLEKSCIVIVDRIPSESLPPGSCRFQLAVARPGSAETTRTLDFTITNGAGR